jgi:hypothetical protein
MVDFKHETRKRCRHCKMNLPTPTGNEREAFFYLHRCMVCEKPIERTTANRKICKRSKCRNALKAGLGFGRYHTNSTKTYQSLKNPELMREVPVPQRSASTSGTVDQANTAFAPRPWRMVAGRLTSNQYHCVVVGDAPDPNVVCRISGMHRYGPMATGRVRKTETGSSWRSTLRARPIRRRLLWLLRRSLMPSASPRWSPLSIPPFSNRRPPPALKEAA